MSRGRVIVTAKRTLHPVKYCQKNIFRIQIFLQLDLCVVCPSYHYDYGHQLRHTQPQDLTIFDDERIKL